MAVPKRRRSVSKIRIGYFKRMNDKFKKKILPVNKCSKCLKYKIASHICKDCFVDFKTIKTKKS